MKKDPIDYFMEYLLPICIGSILASFAVMAVVMAVHVVKTVLL